MSIPKLEVRQALVVSTGHLPPVLSFLTSETLPDDGSVLAQYTDRLRYGCMMRFPDSRQDIEDLKAEGELPAFMAKVMLDFRDFLDRHRRPDVDYIIFDRDAECLPDLPFYDW